MLGEVVWSCICTLGRMGERSIKRGVGIAIFRACGLCFMRYVIIDGRRHVCTLYQSFRQHAGFSRSNISFARVANI